MCIEMLLILFYYLLLLFPPKSEYEYEYLWLTTLGYISLTSTVIYAILANIPGRNSFLHTLKSFTSGPSQNKMRRMDGMRIKSLPSPSTMS